jgi:ribokinase
LEALGVALAVARDAGARTILNPAPATALPPALLQSTDIVVPNEHEVELLGGVAELLRSGVEAVIITRGRNGVTVVSDRGSDSWTAPPFEVDAIDSTGAGDAFCGTLAAALAAGDDLRAAVRRAAAAGALATTRAGAVPSLPDRAAVDALLAAGGA